MAEDHDSQEASRVLSEVLPGLSAAPAAQSPAVHTVKATLQSLQKPVEMHTTSLYGNEDLPSSGQVAADLALLASDFQTLAEVTGRLRQGLDRLLIQTEPAQYLAESGESEAGAGQAGQGPLSQKNVQDTREEHSLKAGIVQRLRTAKSSASSAAAVEEAASAGGRALWVQERLLGAVESLLEEVRTGAAGVFTGALRPQNPTHGKKARAAAAAAAAVAAAAQVDRMELVTTVSMQHGSNNAEGQQRSVQTELPTWPVGGESNNLNGEAGFF
jgi:hypothetical protein